VEKASQNRKYKWHPHYHNSEGCHKKGGRGFFKFIN